MSVVKVTLEMTMAISIYDKPMFEMSVVQITLEMLMAIKI